jgi:putative sigma-54 modulation protein
MDIKIAGTNVEIPDRTQAYIEKKIGKLSKHLPDIIDLQVEVSRENTKSPDESYVVRVTVKSSISETPFHGEERGKTIQMAVDKVSDVMVRQVESYKGKLYDKVRRTPPVVPGKGAASSPSPAQRKIVKVKRFAIEPLTTDLAIQEMEELGHDFFLFLDNETDEIRLLYRRKDGNYGLIEPQIG